MSLLAKFNSINVWKSGGKRATHKPLLVLLAIARCIHQDQRLIPYREIDEQLKRLLLEFGPPNPVRPEYPFWFLQNDGVWQIKHLENVDTSGFSKNPNRKSFLEVNAMGGFNESVYLSLRKNRKQTLEIINNLLTTHFTESYHDDILASVGLDRDLLLLPKRSRNPEFRHKILQAYEYKCAVCGFSGRMEHALVGLEAAHIKWHQAGGPDEEVNGLSLCSLHHKLFDRGIFTIRDMRVHVSEKANGNQQFSRWVLDFHNQPLKIPQRPSYHPDLEFVTWHEQQVFKGPGRYFA